MKLISEATVAVSVLFFAVTLALGESNDSLEALTNAEVQVQVRLERFATSNTNYGLLLEAQKIAASLNPRGDNKTMLSSLDERSLRLQLKVLLALAKARDAHYDPDAPTNRVYLNLIPPLPDSNGVRWPSGIDPNAIKDAKARKAYEAEIAENRRRNDKLKREMELSRGGDRALMDIWLFVKRGLPENSAARNRAIELVTNTITVESLRERFNSNAMPSLTW